LGDDLLAEVRTEADVEGFGVHPALLDAALHPLALTGETGEPVRLPFAWSEVRLHAVGADTLRVRITPAGADSVSLTVTDTSGAPVLTVGSLSVRPLATGDLAADETRFLFHLDW